MIHLMTVPASLVAKVNGGAAFVSGALVKDATSHQILAHLQPTGKLTQWIFNAATAGPLAPLEFASAIGQNVQLLEIRRMLETLQTVAAVGAAASVLNLGVSIGGFAMVLATLRRLERSMEVALATVRRVENMQTAEYIGTTMAAMERAESAFLLPASGDRRRYWQEADYELSRAIGIAVRRMAVQGVELEGPNIATSTDMGAALRITMPESIEMLRWLMTLCTARTEVLLALQMPSEAARLCQRMAAWMSALPFSRKDLALAQLGGRSVPPTQMERVTATANGLATFITQAGTVSLERALLCDTLQRQDTDTLEYVLTVRDHAEATVLMVPH